MTEPGVGVDGEITRVYDGQRRPGRSLRETVEVSSLSKKKEPKHEGKREAEETAIIKAM